MSTTGGTEDPGRVVLVTGGSRGIGEACARWFLERGDKVVATYRTGAPLKPHDDALADRLLAVPCDVRDTAQVDAAFDTVESRFGPVQVLVANAGITHDALMLRMTEDDWSSVIDTNLTGAWRVTKRALKRMVRARAGRIVLVSSAGAFLGVPGQTNYGATKAGLVGMARSLAREVSSRGITVNVVAPGVVGTDMTAALGESRIEELRTMVPLGRSATPEDIAAAVGFFASEEASYVTGAVLPVDGGLGMGW